MIHYQYFLYLMILILCLNPFLFLEHANALRQILADNLIVDDGADKFGKIHFDQRAQS